MEEKIEDRLKFLKLIIHTDSDSCGVTGLCGGYESKEWRYKQFGEWLFDEHLLEFALPYSEFQLINGKSAAKKFRQAARNIFQTDNTKRGEFGEILLHGIIREVYDTIPAVSKIYFKDGPNDTVKGFDAVHIVRHENNLELWLGEVKFYDDFRRAVRDVTKELELHFRLNYLRNEFAAITNKLDKEVPYYTELIKLLDSNTSLDDVFDCICVPVLLTYESNTVLNHRIFNKAYLDKIIPEINANHKHFSDKVKCPVKIHLFLLPLENKEKLSQTLLNRLEKWQNF